MPALAGDGPNQRHALGKYFPVIVREFTELEFRHDLFKIRDVAVKSGTKPIGEDLADISFPFFKKGHFLGFLSDSLDGPGQHFE